MFPESFDCAEDNLGLKRLFLIGLHIPCHYFLTHLYLFLFMLFLSSSHDSEVKKYFFPGLNDLQFTEDGRVKGSATIFFLDPNGQFTGRVIGGSMNLHSWYPQFHEGSPTIFWIKKSAEVIEGNNLCHAE